MILYLAGIGSFKKLHSYVLENFPDIGVLCSYAFPKEFQELTESGFKNIMMDSGAYSVSKRGLAIDLDKYIEFLKSNRDKIDVCVALDVIGNPKQSYENWLYMIDKGIDNAIPVYHLGEDIKWLDLYCEKTDFVGIGGIAGSVTNWKLYIPFLRRIVNRYPNHKFHAFGLNSYKALRMVDLYSCDATSWLVGQKFAELSSDNGRIKLRREHQNADIWKELEEKWQINYSDFVDNKHDYLQFNKFNIKYLYDLISNHQKIEVSEMEELF